MFNQGQTVELEDIVRFQKEWIQNRPTVYGILSDLEALDVNYLSDYGPVVLLGLEDIFGY